MTTSRITKLKRQQNAVQAALKKAVTSQRNFAELAVLTCEEMENEVAEAENATASSLGLHSQALSSWLCLDIEAQTREWCPTHIGTAGSGPWPIAEFDRLLSSMGFSLGNLPHPELTCIVLGTEAWEAGPLEEQVLDRNGENLMVLSQAMFIAGILKNVNPLLALAEDDLLALASNHPALTHLADLGFDWPFSTGGEIIAEWEPGGAELAEESPLRKAGYSAGAAGRNDAARRQILTEFFFNPAPLGLDNPADQARWGRPRSQQRLYSMATFIAWLCRFRAANAPNAVARWQSDLVWLEQEYYSAAMGFNWPAD